MVRRPAGGLGINPANPSSARSSPPTKTSITRTGLSSQIQSSRHSGKRVLCPRSSLNKALHELPRKSWGNLSRQGLFTQPGSIADVDDFCSRCQSRLTIANIISDAADAGILDANFHYWLSGELKTRRSDSTEFNSSVSLGLRSTTQNPCLDKLHTNLRVIC